MIDAIVCARDAAGTLGDVLGRLPTRLLRSVVVIDRASTDATSQIARDGGAVVLRTDGPGYGAACRRAITHLEALPRPPDAVALVPATGEVSPEDLPALTAPITANDADLVIGTRTGSTSRGARARMALGLIGVLYRHRFDGLGPFRVIRFPALVALGMSDRGAGFDVEMQVKALRYGLRIVEIPLTAGGVARKSAIGPRTALCEAEKTSRVLFHILRHTTAR